MVLGVRRKLNKKRWLTCAPILRTSWRQKGSKFRGLELRKEDSVSNESQLVFQFMEAKDS